VTTTGGYHRSSCEPERTPRHHGGVRNRFFDQRPKKRAAIERYFPFPNGLRQLGGFTSLPPARLHKFPAVDLSQNETMPSESNQSHWPKELQNLSPGPWRGMLLPGTIRRLHNGKSRWAIGEARVGPRRPCVSLPACRGTVGWAGAPLNGFASPTPCRSKLMFPVLSLPSRKPKRILVSHPSVCWQEVRCRARGYDLATKHPGMRKSAYNDVAPPERIRKACL